MMLLILWALLVPIGLGLLWCSNRALARVARWVETLESPKTTHGRER